MAKAFDPFFTTKGVGKGTGLGLSQVYGMVRQAGGIARIESSPGQGTTVALFLPHAINYTDTEPRRDQDASAPATITATVLAVDDDPDVRRFLAASLESLGYGVLEAEDGYAGLAALARSSPDVMIIDYAMPGMTGAEVAREARIKFPGLPIIFASGYSETAAIEKVLDANTGVLRKPFAVSELQEALVKILVR